MAGLVRVEGPRRPRRRGVRRKYSAANAHGGFVGGANDEVENDEGDGIERRISRGWCHRIFDARYGTSQIF